MSISELNTDWRHDMTDEVETTQPATDAEPGLLAEGTTRIAAVIIAVVALAGISAGAWLRWRHS
jgi:hypothetical protein